MKEEKSNWIDGLVKIEIPTEFAKNTFVSNQNNATGIEILYFRNSSNHIVSKIKFGKFTLGPPGLVHGGAISAVLDEIMGAECFNNGYLALTKELNVKFIKPVPINNILFAIGNLDNADTRILRMSAKLFDENKRIYSISNGIFRIVKEI